MCRARLNRRAMLSNSDARKVSAAVVADGCLVSEKFSLYCADQCRHECGAGRIRGRKIIEATCAQGYMGESGGSQLSVQRGMAVREGFLTEYLSARFRISLCDGIRKFRCCDSVAIQRRMKLGCARGHMIERNGPFPRREDDSGERRPEGSHDSAEAERKGVGGVSRARPYPEGPVHRSRSRRRPAVIPGERSEGRGSMALSTRVAPLPGPADRRG